MNRFVLPSNREQCALSPSRPSASTNWWTFHAGLLPALALLLFGTVAPCFGVTFTQDTLISYTNFAYDGLDLIVTNCTVTVDGAHGFLGVHILNGGVLTHTATTNTVLGTNSLVVTDEAHSMSPAFPAVLNHPNVDLGSVVVTDPTGSNVFLAGSDYSLTVSNAFTSINLLPGSGIPDGATVLANYTALDALVFTGLQLAVTNDVEIEVGGAINANGKGYGPGFGPGAGNSLLTNFPSSYYAGSGGGHGGFGGISVTRAEGGNAYGSITTPTDSGSGGGAGTGAGGWGGGVVNLSVGGLLRVNGQLKSNGANGVNPHSGGGAGGSILLSAQAISGSGTISANGGGGEPQDGGGGGGGQIALYSINSNTFSGILSAAGGTRAASGGAGTIYSANPLTNINPRLVVDNGGQNGASTLLSAAGIAVVTLSGGAIAQPAANLTLRSLTIRSNCWLTWGPNQSQTITILSNATIDARGGITADGKGFTSGLGTGAGHSVLASNVFTGSGASYAGIGGPSAYGATAGIAYGSMTQPQDLGSGGGSGNAQGNTGGSGGGRAQLSVQGVLTVNGLVSANGSSGGGPGSGGGSGGTIWLLVTTIAGNGTISANGGAGVLPFGGGGGGGRVAIQYTNLQFTGNVMAHGGAGATNGGAGTIYWRGQGSTLPQVTVDNAGLASPGNTVLVLTGVPCNLTISGRAMASHTNATIANLLIASNSWLTSLSGSALLQISVTNSATIQSGGGITLDGLGSAAGSGTGAGRTVVSTFYGTVGSGGGYGGAGGASISNNPGGTAYGNFAAPSVSGSGGGNGTGTAPNNAGGSGGGALQLTVGNSLIVDGSITANGKSGVGRGSGGGSGGTLQITAGTISGNGNILAAGGNGDLPYGGGGGGGRVAVSYRTNLFAGNLRAYGGSGYTYGGAGTVFIGMQSVTQPLPNGILTIDNGGKSGTNTPLTATNLTYDLTISGGARAVTGPLTSPYMFRTLLITSNSWLLITNLQQTVFNITNASIQAGGGIIADGFGSAAGAGQGAGHSSSQIGLGGSVGSGAGHGGAGGASSFGPGGIIYDSISAPTLSGSGGGNGSLPTVPSGGAGGGAFRLNVSGSLTVNGNLSANGLSATDLGSGGGQFSRWQPGRRRWWCRRSHRVLLRHESIHRCLRRLRR